MINDKLFLLSASEVEEYLPSKESRICLFKGEKYWWWLRSSVDKASVHYDGYLCLSYAASVHYDGYLCLSGSFVDYSSMAVRPALHIKLEYLESLNRTDEGYVLFGIGNRKWIVLDEETGLLFSYDAVCLHRFDEKSNNYEESEIRAYLNGELLNELFTREEQKMIVDTVIDGETSYPAI